MARANTSSAESWKPVPSFPGLEVSDLGNARSYWDRVWTGRGCGRIAIESPRPIVPFLSSRGYAVIRYADEGGVQRTLQMHRLVLTAFKGPCPEGMEGCHRDGTRTNSRLDNLYWGTRGDNCLDTVVHGRNRKVKLTQAQVDEAVSLRSQGMTQVQIASRLGVNQCVISTRFLRLGLRSRPTHARFLKRPG